MNSPIMLEEALILINKGLSATPFHSPTPDGHCDCWNADCKSPGKHPHYLKGILENGILDATDDPERLKQLFEKWPNANIAIRAGQDTGIMVLDIDPRNEGSESLAQLVDQYGPLPNTVTEDTGGGGLHYFFHYKDKPIPNRTGLNGILPGVEVKGDGGAVVVCPSLHYSGKRYQWQPGHAPGEIAMAPPPTWLLELIYTQPAKKGKALNAADSQFGQIAEGGRNSFLTSVAGKLRRVGFDEEDMDLILQGINEAKCAEPLDQTEVSRIAGSVGGYTPAFACTDMGNAERFIHYFGLDLMYCTDRGCWYIWSGNRWEPDSTHQVEELAKMAVRRIPFEVEPGKDSDRYTTLLRWAAKSESAPKLAAMLKLAQSDPNVVATTNYFDANSWLFNVANGTIDLKTGELNPHDRRNLITKLSPVHYDPTASCPAWCDCLLKYMSGDLTMVEYLQRIFGYSLTGSTHEQSLFIAYGQGSNGKSTLVNTIKSIMGDYALQTSPETLMVKKQQGISNDIARLKGARMVIAAEGEDGQRLAESLVKEMTGGDTLTARFLFGEYFEFKPQFKIILTTNHKPNIRGTDDGIWRRIKPIPFMAQFMDSDRKKDFQSIFEPELPGILAWLVQGCLAWQISGITEPLAVKGALAIYRDEMDPIANFLGEMYDLIPSAYVEKQEVYRAYQQWCDTNGEHYSTSRFFGKRMRERGFETDRGNGGRKTWKGLKLCNPYPVYTSGLDALRAEDLIPATTPSPDCQALAL